MGITCDTLVSHRSSIFLKPHWRHYITQVTDSLFQSCWWDQRLPCKPYNLPLSGSLWPLRTFSRHPFGLTGVDTWCQITPVQPVLQGTLHPLPLLPPYRQPAKGVENQTLSSSLPFEWWVTGFWRFWGFFLRDTFVHQVSQTILQF